MKQYLKKLVTSAILTLTIVTPVFASIPDNLFGGGSRDIHIASSRVSTENTSSNHISSNSNNHLGFSIASSSYNKGDRIGTLRIERLNRTIAIFEGSSMRNMDLGAGRFIETGLHSGNVAVIGHNRGSNGFFSFVRLLNEGDIIMLEISGISRTFKVSHEIIVHETNTDILSHFGDERLTMITCVEYRPRYRRVAIAFEI